MMQLVIKLSESAYKEMCEYGTDRVNFDIQQMISRGTPLPKGHGRLIDVDKLRSGREETIYGGLYPPIMKIDLDNVPVIIEAEKEN